MGKKLAVLLILLLVTIPLYAQESPPEAHITGVWARPAQVDTGGVTAAYMTLENAGNVPLRLVGAASPVAAEVHIHESRMVDNVMQMRPVEGIDIAPGETAALEPGGYHMMLMGLQQDLVAGDAFSLDLTFEQPDGGDPIVRTIGVPVLEDAPPPSDLVVLDVWARPTAMLAGDDQDGTMSTGGDMPGMAAEETPEASMDDHSIAMGEGNLTVTSDVTAVYIRLLNRGTQDDQIVGAQSDVAGMVEIHETQVVDNVMQMRPVEAIDVPAGDRAELKPGSYHIMLMGVQRGLVVGDAIMVALVFESGTELPVAVPVRDNLAG